MAAARRRTWMQTLLCRASGLVALLIAAGIEAKEPPFALPPPNEIGKLRSAVVETDRGLLLFELFPQEAPWHVANFKYLADKGFYRNRRFDIHYPEYIIQGGGAGRGKSIGHTLPPEFSPRTHQTGTLGMARAEDRGNPERRSDGTRFHLLLSPGPHMNGSYTIFGELRQGFEVLKELRAGDAIRDVRVFVREAPQ